jgi:hypothetical protein
MNIDQLISTANDLLQQADWLTYNNWGAVSQVLDAVIPNAWSNYQP